MTSSLNRVAHGLSAFAIGLASLASAAPALANDVFTDVATANEFHIYISSLYNAGVISGVTPTTFEPMRNMTRGEVSKVVVKAKGLAINTAGGPHFSDVPVSNTFYSYIETLSNAGVVSGFGDGTFRPAANVTRGEYSKIVTRTWSINIDLTGAPHFKDVGSSNPAYQYVETLKNNNIISGYPDGNFRPDWPILRQEVAKMTDRTMKLAMTSGFNTGTGARLDVQGNAEQVAANCFSTVAFTVTSYDALGNVNEAFTDNVTVKTSLGKFSTSGTDTETKQAASGRAQFTLTSCTAGTATVTATAGSMSSSDDVRFSTTAQGPNEGKGPTCVTGTGCMSVSVVSDKLLTATDANTTALAQLDPVIGGYGTLEAYLYDSNGDPMDLGDAAIRCTIIAGTGAAIAPLLTFPVFPQGAEDRSELLDNTFNGRYAASYGIVTNQIPGTVTIECTDLLASPALTTQKTIDVKVPTVKTWVADSTLLATNATPTGANTVAIEPTFPGLQTRTAIFATLTDQYGDPRTLDCGGAVGAENLQARVTSGPSDTIIAADNLGVLGFLSPVAMPADVPTDGSNAFLQGLYAGSVIAGRGPGSVTIEVRADQCTTQPRATTSVTIAEPKLEIYASSTTLGPAQTSTIVAKLTDQNGKPLTGEVLNAVVESGPSGTAIVSPMIEHGNFPGFYYATLTAGAVATSQSIVVRVTDPARVGSGSQPVQGTITLQASPSNTEGSVATSMTLVPLRTTVGINQNIPVQIMLRDSRGNGVAGACALVLGSVVVGNATVMDSPPTVIAPDDGLCYARVSMGATVGNVRAQFRYTPGAGIPLVQEVSFDVRDRSIDVEAVNAKLTIGDGSGSIVYVRDEVGDSVNGITFAQITTVPSDTRVVVTEEQEIGFDPAGAYVYAYRVPEDLAISSFTIRSTLVAPAAVTNPTDSVTITASPVSITLQARPDAIVTGDCLVIEALVKSASGAPMTGGSLTFEVTSSTGGNGTLTADNLGCAAGAQRVTAVTDNGQTTNDGIYLVTYRASSIASSDNIRAYLPDMATTPEANITVRSR